MKKFLLVLGFNIMLLGMIEEPKVRVIRSRDCCPDSFGMVAYTNKFQQPMTPQERSSLMKRIYTHDPVLFTRYQCAREQTDTLDDERPLICIRKNLLMRMLVHLSETSEGYADAYTISRRMLPHTPQVDSVHITKKDWFARLLSQMPWNGLEGGCYPLMIKGICVHIKRVSCIHVANIIEPCTAHQNIPFIVDQEKIEQEFKNLFLVDKIT